MLILTASLRMNPAIRGESIPAMQPSPLTNPKIVAKTKKKKKKKKRMQYI